MTGIDAFVADGDRWDGRIVLRITEVHLNRGVVDKTTRTVRCYEEVFELGSHDVGPDRIAGPGAEALDLEPSEPEPTTPPGAADALLRRLQALDRGSITEEQVLAPALTAAGASLATRDLHRERLGRQPMKMPWL